MNTRSYVGKLLHERLVDMKTSRRVEEYVVVAVVLSVFQRLFGNFYGVLGAHFKYGYADLLADNLKLFYSCGTVYVAGNEKRSVPFFFELESELCGVSRFTASLKAAHHYDCGRVVRDGKSCLGSAHKLGQLFVYYFNNHLAGRKTFHNVCADSPFGYLFCKFFGYLVVYVCFKKSKANLAHGFFNISLGQFSLGTKLFKRIFKAFAESFKCHD